jgi:hypothetical protein
LPQEDSDATVEPMSERGVRRQSFRAGFVSGAVIAVVTDVALTSWTLANRGSGSLERSTLQAILLVV